MHMDFGNEGTYSVTSKKKEKTMSAKRELCCAQLFGVFLFCVGLVGGILIGIYAYHGGPDAEVTCKVCFRSLLKKKIVFN